MSGEYGPPQGDIDFKAPKEEPKPEKVGQNTELDKDKVYEELFAKMDALKNLKDFANPDPKLVSGLFNDRGKLFGYDDREKELQGRINDMFAELYKREDEMSKKRDEKWERGEKRTVEDGAEDDNYLYLMSDLREEVEKAGFGIPIKQ